MPIKLCEGFIYFLGEWGGGTERSSYVKIGMTTFDRPVEDRIDDHQTGNPRILVMLDHLPVVSVDTVETHLHHVFAEYRILGEWFLMDDSTVEKAIAEARRINSEIKAIAGTLEMSREEGYQVSSEPERVPHEEELSLLVKTVEAAEAVNRLEARQACVEWELRAAMGSSKGIEDIINVVSLNKSSRFHEAALKTEEPDIYKQFLVETSSLEMSFSLAAEVKSARELEPDLVAREEELKEISVVTLERFDKPIAARTEELDGLHEQYLKGLGKLSHAYIQKDLLEARIKAFCGKAKGIKGVCHWSRKPRVKKKFDRWGFLEAHPELFPKYLLPPPAPELRVSISPMRPISQGISNRYEIHLSEEEKSAKSDKNQFNEPEVSFNEWPFPVAMTRHKVVVAQNPLLRFFSLLDHFDCLVRYAYLSHEVMAGKIPDMVDKPSLGWWVDRLAHSVKDDSSFREVLKITEKEKVVNIRNETRGHGYMGANVEIYRSDAKDLEAIIEEIEDELRPFLEEQRLVIPTQISLRDSSWFVEGEKLQGSHPLHPPFFHKMEDDPRSMGMTSENEVFLARPKMKKFYKMSPYVIKSICPECRHERILLIDGAPKYIDIYVGHRVKL